LTGDIQVDRGTGFDHIGDDQFAGRRQPSMPSPHQRGKFIPSHVLDDGHDEYQIDTAGIQLSKSSVIQNDDAPIVGQTLAEALPDGGRRVVEVEGGTPIHQTLGAQGFTATEIKNDLLAFGRDKILEIPRQALEMCVEVALVHVNRVRLVPKVDP